MSKIHVRVQSIEDKIANYVMENPIDIYVDYNDTLSDKQVEEILKGHADEVRSEIEMDYDPWGAVHESYWEELCSEVGCSQDDIDDWLSNEGFHPSYVLDDHGWRQLLRNTQVYVEAVVWDAEFNFNNWAYGGPVSYSDVKETLKLFGINPKEFHDGVKGGSMTAGEGRLTGWFPDMPDREPKVNIKDIWDNMCTLYNGVVVFCLGDLENLAEVLAEDTKNITFKAGTNVVVYEFGGGAGITDFPLTGDVTIQRKKVDFRVSGTYGIQACYGFMHSYWSEGTVQGGGDA